MSAVDLLKAVCTLNSRIRSNGLSSKEMLTRRDQLSGHHLSFTDQVILNKQQKARDTNHPSSSKSKARGACLAPPCQVGCGGLVFLKDEGSKFKPRCPYMVIDIKGQDFILQKMSSTGLLSSKQYIVPKNKVFPMVNTGEKEKVIAPSDSSSDSDSDSADNNVHLDIDSNPIRQDVPAVDSNDQRESTSSRPLRNRRKPDFYGAAKDTDSVTHSDESDLIDNWYPHWDKDRTRRYIDNGQQELP